MRLQTYESAPQTNLHMPPWGLLRAHFGLNVGHATFEVVRGYLRLRKVNIQSKHSKHPFRINRHMR